VKEKEQRGDDIVRVKKKEVGEGKRGEIKSSALGKTNCERKEERGGVRTRTIISDYACPWPCPYA
jgi:hypothetical protein